MKKQLKEVLDKYKLNISDEKCEKLWNFVEMMKKYNETTNITAITDNNDIIYKHILDSLLPVGLFKENQKVLDIGCGAGFPSIPLTIALENVQFTAIDSVNKKTNFVNMVKNDLNLANINVFHTRIEDFLIKPEFREQFDIVVSRAVAPLNIIIEYSAPALKNGGKIIAYKGSNYQEEIDNASNALKLLNCHIDNTIQYNIEEINADRYIIEITKLKSVSSKYPRKQNKPRTQPL
jgi:16S rRNA (guanine527-N7)-methyltransferase